jgi:hypothetical protein
MKFTPPHAAPVKNGVYHTQRTPAFHSAFTRVIAAYALLGFPGSLLALRALATDERHAFAVESMPVSDAVKPGDASATLLLRCKYPVDGEYSAVVLYDINLQDIDARLPLVKRPFAGSVAVAMGVGLSVKITDTKSGTEVDRKLSAPTVFDATTKKLNWSGERLAVFQLKRGVEYDIEVGIEELSPAWMSRHPVVILDRSEEVAKTRA